MKKKILLEFFNYIFFYRKFSFILKTLFKKKKNKSYNKLLKIISKHNHKLKYKLFNNKFSYKNKKNIFYLNIFKNKYYFISNQWNEKNKFTDREIFYYKIRFNWLFFDNDHLSTNIKINLIISFIINYNLFKSDAYGLSERISNWIMFLQSNKKYISLKNRELIEQSIKKQLNILINKIEFYNEKTNNHILSNTKAIFLYILYFDNNEHSVLCKELFNFLSKHIFFKSGILNEGSSHYHLLISKHIIEILYFNETKKNDILSEKNTNFFLKVLKNIYVVCITEDIVNFGDSTPELPIKYLKLLPFISKKLFNIEYSVSFKKTELKCNNYLKIFNLRSVKVPYLTKNHYHFYDKNSGFLFISFHNIKFYSQLTKTNIIKSRSHQHTEIGNFIVYYNDELIFNNLGRKNYNSETLLSIGSASHNSYTINNIEPILCHKLNAIPSIMHQDYFQNKPKYKIDIDNNEINISSTFSGYKRYSFNSIVTRKIKITKNQIDINDNINSRKNVKFDSYFHTNLNTSIKDKLIILKKQNKNICKFRIDK